MSPEFVHAAGKSTRVQLVGLPGRGLGKMLVLGVLLTLAKLADGLPG